LISYISFGFDPGRFGRLTPRDLDSHFRGINERTGRERQRDLSLAWHIAGFMRMKRLPPLDQVLKSAAPKRTAGPSWERQLDIAMQWHRAVTRG
jgi:hypothetical protein